MDITFETFKKEFEQTTGLTLNALVNEFSEQYLAWKQVKLLEALNDKFDKIK